MATAAPRLRKEHRSRIRAFTLWLIGGVAILLAGVLTYALAVGFAVPSTGAVHAVAPTDEGERDLMVRAVIGTPGCEELVDVDAQEAGDEVALTVHTSIPHGTRWDFSCPDVATFVYATVRLDRPLGERTVIDDDSGSAVPVADSPADLVAHED